MSDWVEKLKQLGELRDSGALSDKEFEAAKKTHVLITRHCLMRLKSLLRN